MIPLLLRRSRLPAVLAAGVVLLGACSSSGGPSSSNAATVGDAEITNERLEQDMALFGFLAALNGGECGAPIEGESQEAACARLTLSNEIREELVKAYAAENDLALEGTEVADAIAQLEQNLGGAEALDAQLEEAGVTRAELEALAGRLLLFDIVQQAVAAEGLDEESLRAAYEEQLGAFTTLEVAHILVPDEADAQAIADSVTPETFAEVAASESQDPGSAANGGNLGSYSQATFESQFVPEFVAGALALEPGEISGPVQSSFGYHVIYLIRRDVAPFEDVRPQLEAEQGGPLFEQWFVDEAAATDIVVNPRWGSFDETTLDVLPVRSTAEEPADATGSATGS